MKHFVCLILALSLFPLAAFSATVDVTVGPGLSFSPSAITVAPGDTVRWVWQGALHSSTSNTTTGAEVWDSGLRNTGTFSHSFTTVGDWPYYCSVHSSPAGTAMNGVVHVVAPTPTPTLSITVLLLLMVVLAAIGMFALRN
jgi:plastocyanin